MAFSAFSKIRTLTSSPSQNRNVSKGAQISLLPSGNTFIKLLHSKYKGGYKGSARNQVISTAQYQMTIFSAFFQRSINDFPQNKRMEVIYLKDGELVIQGNRSTTFSIPNAENKVYKDYTIYTADKDGYRVSYKLYYVNGNVLRLGITALKTSAG